MRQITPRLLLAAAFVSPVLSAQQQVLEVRGKLVDTTDAPVANAPVSLADANGRVLAQTTSAANGDFTLSGLAAGSYTLSVEAWQGFAAHQRSVRVQAGIPALRVVLAPESVAQTIDVGSGEPLSTEASANRDSVSVTGDSMNHLPVFDQNYIATLTPFLDAAATSTSGVSIVVDGVEMKGPNVSPSAIAEVKINSDPYSAEFASPGRGRIEITTKPGSQQYHGTINVISRNAVFNAKNYFAPTRPDEQRYIFEGHLSGPVGRGRHTTFLLSGTRRQEDVQSAVRAAGVSGPIQLNVPAPNREWQVSGRITHDFSDAHRLMVGYNFHYTSSQNLNVSGIVLPEAGYNNTNRQDQVLFNDRIIVSPHLIHQFQLVLEKETDNTFSASNAVSIQVQDSFTGGGAQADVFRTENTFVLMDMVSWSHGKHYVRFGINMPQTSRRAVNDHSNRTGTYFFNSITDYVNQTPYQFTVQQGRGRGLYWINEIGPFVQDEISLRKNLQIALGVRYQWQTYMNRYGNFAPRASLAYAAKAGWMIRTGAGIFYDRTGGDYVVTFPLHNGVELRQYQVLDPGYPSPLRPGQNFNGLPVSIATEDPNLRAPYQLQYSATVERQLGPGLTVTATYRGITGVASLRSRDINAPLPPVYGARPDSTRGFVQQVEAGGRSRLNAFDLGLRGHAGAWFQGQMQYTFSHSNNNTSGISWYPQNQYLPNAEWGRADADRRHRLNILGTIHPDHWLTLGIASAFYTGAPYNQLAGADFYNTGLSNARPAGVARNTLQGGGTINLDLLWDHDFRLNHAKGEKAKVINIGVSGFNVLNHANFNRYLGNIRSTLYGQPTTALAARQLQFSARYQF